jgi:hypothetical protein
MRRLVRLAVVVFGGALGGLFGGPLALAAPAKKPTKSAPKSTASPKTAPAASSKPPTPGGPLGSGTLAMTPSAASQPSLPGAYEGVVPGEGNRAPRAIKPGTTPAAVTWPGFQLTDSGSRVFLQLTAPVQFQSSTQAPVAPAKGSKAKPPKPAPTVLVVTLSGARIHLSNNERPLDTSFFPTPVLSAQIRPSGNDVQLLITLRDPTAAPHIHLDPSPTGYSFLFVDFGPYTLPASTPTP